LSSSFGFPETDDFADDLTRALSNCGLEMSFTRSVLIFPVPRTVRIGFAPNSFELARMIAKAMRDASLVDKPVELMQVPDADKNPDALRIFIGPKVE
jgi:hypothetical protein